MCIWTCTAPVQHVHHTHGPFAPPHAHLQVDPNQPRCMAPVNAAGGVCNAPVLLTDDCEDDTDVHHKPAHWARFVAGADNVVCRLLEGLSAKAAAGNFIFPATDAAWLEVEREIAEARGAGTWRFVFVGMPHDSARGLPSRAARWLRRLTHALLADLGCGSPDDIAAYEAHCPDFGGYTRVADTIGVLPGAGEPARQVLLLASLCPQRNLTGDPAVAASWTGALHHVLHQAVARVLDVVLLNVPLRPGCVKTGAHILGCAPVSELDHALAQQLLFRVWGPVLGACGVRAVPIGLVWGARCAPLVVAPDATPTSAADATHALLGALVEPDRWHAFAHPTCLSFGIHWEMPTAILDAVARAVPDQHGRPVHTVVASLRAVASRAVDVGASRPSPVRGEVRAAAPIWSAPASAATMLQDPRVRVRLSAANRVVGPTPPVLHAGKHRVRAAASPPCSLLRRRRMLRALFPDGHAPFQSRRARVVSGVDEAVNGAAETNALVRYLGGSPLGMIGVVGIQHQYWATGQAVPTMRRGVPAGLLALMRTTRAGLRASSRRRQPARQLTRRTGDLNAAVLAGSSSAGAGSSSNSSNSSNSSSNNSSNAGSSANNVYNNFAYPPTRPLAGTNIIPSAHGVPAIATAAALLGVAAPYSSRGVGVLLYAFEGERYFAHARMRSDDGGKRLVATVSTCEPARVWRERLGFRPDHGSRGRPLKRVGTDAATGQDMFVPAGRAGSWGPVHPGLLIRLATPDEEAHARALQRRAQDMANSRS